MLWSTKSMSPQNVDKIILLFITSYLHKTTFALKQCRKILSKNISAKKAHDFIWETCPNILVKRISRNLGSTKLTESWERSKELHESACHIHRRIFFKVKPNVCCIIHAAPLPFLVTEGASTNFNDKLASALWLTLHLNQAAQVSKDLLLPAGQTVIWQTAVENLSPFNSIPMQRTLLRLSWANYNQWSKYSVRGFCAAITLSWKGIRSNAIW